MASTSTKDHSALRSDASFDRAPPAELEETLPFSLLNELLGDLGVSYNPPPVEKAPSPAASPGIPSTASSDGGRPSSPDSEPDTASAAPGKGSATVAPPTPKPTPPVFQKARPRSPLGSSPALSRPSAPPVPTHFPKFAPPAGRAAPPAGGDDRASSAKKPLAPRPEGNATAPGPLSAPGLENGKGSTSDHHPASPPRFPKPERDAQRRTSHGGFQSRAGNRPADPLDKALRIFQSFKADTPAKAEAPVSPEEPTLQPLDETEAPAPALAPESKVGPLESAASPETDTLDAEPEPLPPQEAASEAPLGPGSVETAPPQADKRLEATSPPTEITSGSVETARQTDTHPAATSPPAQTVSGRVETAPPQADTRPAATSSPAETAAPLSESVSEPLSAPAAYYRRRRRRAPVNPWTAHTAAGLPTGAVHASDDHIFASLEELARILQASLDQRAPSQIYAPSSEGISNATSDPSPAAVSPEPHYGQIPAPAPPIAAPDASAAGLAPLDPPSQPVAETPPLVAQDAEFKNPEPAPSIQEPLGQTVAPAHDEVAFEGSRPAPPNEGNPFAETIDTSNAPAKQLSAAPFPDTLASESRNDAAPPSAPPEADPAQSQPEGNRTPPGTATVSPEVAPPPGPSGSPETPPILRKSFTSDTSPTFERTKTKLVPRLPIDPSTPNVPSPAFEITAPTTLLGKDAPISPFTKVAQGQDENLYPFGKPSPPPSVPASKSPEAAGATPFASPFATAIKKRQESPETATPAPPKVAPISPPQNREAPLPPPAVSFASPLPGTQPSPPASSPQAQTLPASEPIPPRTAPTPPEQDENPAEDEYLAIPRPRHSASPILIRPAAPGESETGTRWIRHKKRKARQSTSPKRWRFLTLGFALVCILLLVLYLFEVYHSFTAGAGEKPWVHPLLAEERVPAPPPAAPLDLSEPLECLTQFLKSPSNETRQHFVLEDEPGLKDTMDAHYQRFPLGPGTPTQIVDGGTFPQTGREYVTVSIEWEDGSGMDTRLIRDDQGDFRFSWHAFEQARLGLLRRYAETSWTGWTIFYVELHPVDPQDLPPGVITENLYFRITVSEDPNFEAIAYVDARSTVSKTFREAFLEPKTYPAIVDLQRDQKLLDDERPVFRLTNLVQSGWDPAQAFSS